MSSHNTQPDPQQAKAANAKPPIWTIPFLEMMEKMMADCGCRPGQNSTMWVTCCGIPAGAQNKCDENQSDCQHIFLNFCGAGPLSE